MRKDKEIHYQNRAQTKGKWKLAGSIKIREGADLDKAFAEMSKRHAELAEESIKRSTEEFLREP